VHNVRSRLINFRVTEEEFDLLKNAAEAQGSRCLSEFARLVMLGTGTKASADANSLDERLYVVDRRLSALEENVARLMRAPAGYEVEPNSAARGASCADPG
jgi:uncharacterized protein (DUF1778 family)